MESNKREGNSSMSAWSNFRFALRADRLALRDLQSKYNADRGELGSFASDVARRIGFQMTFAIRLMHLVRDLRIPLGAAIVSRLIRHVYGAEIHWEADIAPGIGIIHGNGLVISHAATVGAGCVLFQGVTLGESMDPVSKIQGAPTLGNNVHVMPNAVLIGPITVGDNSKVGANVTLSSSVAAWTSVRSPTPEFVVRSTSPQVSVRAVP
jgi:serine acetyltransferase